MNISEQNESEPILIQEYKSPAGALLLGSYRGRLCLCDWKYRTMRDSIDRRIQKILKAVYKQQHQHHHHHHNLNYHHHHYCRIRRFCSR